MTRRLIYLHTVLSLAGLFSELSKELLPPDVEIYHIADEMLLKIALKNGGLTPFLYRRVADHASAAEAAGADVLQVTCSSISPCVDAAAKMVRIPVLKVDEPMVRQALTLGSRIGVAATLPTTLRPTCELVQEQARQMGKAAQVEAVLCPGAFDALSAGDPGRHDEIVRQSLADLMERCEVVLLAQASMARVAETLPAEARKTPVLSSPRFAVEHAASFFQAA